MEEKIFSLKILIHSVNLNRMIFNEDYQQITRPMFAVKFGDFPVIVIKGKRAIKKEDLLDMAHLREAFSNGASTIFQLPIEELQKMLKEKPLIIHFLDSTMAPDKPSKAIGRMMISLLNFSTSLSEPLADNSENFKRHSFSLLDAMGNLIGQVDLSISLALRGFGYINKSMKKADKAEEDNKIIKKSIEQGAKEESNLMLNTFGAGFGAILNHNHSVSENSSPMMTLHKAKSLNEENRSPHNIHFFENAKATMKKAAPNHQQAHSNKHNKDAVVQTVDRASQEEFDKRNKNFNDEFFMKRNKKLVEPPAEKRIPDVREQITIVQPSLSLFTEGHFCPPVMFLHKKTNEESPEHFTSGTQKGFKLASASKELTVPGHKRASSKIKIVENEVVNMNNTAFPKPTSPKQIFNPFLKGAPPSLDSLKKSFVGSSQGLLDALIEELLALRSLRNNLMGSHENVKRSTDRLSSTRAQNMVRNPSEDLRSKHGQSNTDLRRSREIATKPHEVEEDYADDFDSVSMSYREGKKSIIDFQASQSHDKLRKNNGNAKLKQSMVSHISENYGEDFDSYSHSASRIKTEYDNSSNFGNSSSQKTALCYICNEKIDPKKANEHIKICKKSNVKSGAGNRKQHSNKNLIGSMDNATASIVSINEEEEINNNGQNSRRHYSRSESRIKTEEYEDDFEEIEEDY